MGDPTCPQGHPLGSVEGCAVPECFGKRVAHYFNGEPAPSEIAKVADYFRAAIAPLQAKVRELENPSLSDLSEREALRSEYIVQLQEALAAKDAELARVLHATRNLLARIHRDGGHHTEAVGFVQSCHDAEARWIEAEKEHDE